MNDVNTHIDPDTLAAYALDALELNEVIEIGRHLQVCPECQREVASLRASASLLPYGLPAGEPPADLRDRVLRAATSGGPAPARESQRSTSGGRTSWSTWFR